MGLPINTSSALLLIVAVGLVGILHTLVPDHWGPIVVIARQRGWSLWQTARAAALAGVGHSVSTLAIGAVVWLGGVALATHFGNIVGTLSSVALMGFGGWIAIASLRELRAGEGDGHSGHDHFAHAHLHRHTGGPEHLHWHEHRQNDWHEVDGNLALAPVHEHTHETSSRTALLLILGSSPMVEGIPAFFAASRLGFKQLLVMGVVFAACTIATYVFVSVLSAKAVQRVNLGPIERYGEVISGAFIAALGLVFLFVPGL